MLIYDWLNVYRSDVMSDLFVIVLLFWLFWGEPNNYTTLDLAINNAAYERCDR